MTLRQEAERIFYDGMASAEWMKKLVGDGNISELDRTLVVALVDKIIVHEDNCLEIIFKYEDEYKTACKVVETVSLYSGQERFSKERCS